MVEITQEHKHQLKATSGQNDVIVSFYDEDNNWVNIDISKMETPDIWALRNRMQRFYQEELATIDAELDNWTTIYCVVCGEEDLAYRGQPFITWGLRGGHILCPRHLRAYDRIGTPEAAILKQAKEEAREIKELFG